MMKSVLLIAIGAVSLLSAGCADDPLTSTGQSTAPAGVKSYRQDELQKTGRTETGQALQAADPRVQEGGLR